MNTRPHFRNGKTFALLPVPVVLSMLIQTASAGATKTLTVDNGAWAADTNWLSTGLPTTTDNAVILGAGTHDISGSAFQPTGGVGSTEIQDLSFMGLAATTLINNSATDDMILKLNGGRGAGVPLIQTSANVLDTIAGAGAGATPHTLALRLLTGGEIRVAGAGQLDIAAAIQESGGAFGFTKTGTGTLTLAGANTFTGRTTLAQGVIVLGSAGGRALRGNVTLGTGAQNGIFLNMAAPNQFGAGSVLTFNNGTGNDAKFELRGFSQTVAGLISDQDDTLSIIQNRETGAPGTATLTIDTSGIFVFHGLIRTMSGGALNLVKTGLGTQEIRNVTAQPHNFGTATINAGALVFNLSGPTASLGAGTAISVAPGAALGLNGSWNMNRPISGAGDVLKLGTGNITISGVNNFTGTFATLGGTTTLASPLANATINNAEGILNINASATNSTVNVSAVTNFGTSQTLAELNIVDGAKATVGALPSPLLPMDDALDFAEQAPLNPVPEPASLSLLLLGALNFARRRGK